MEILGPYRGPTQLLTGRPSRQICQWAFSGPVAAGMASPSSSCSNGSHATSCNAHAGRVHL